MFLNKCWFKNATMLNPSPHGKQLHKWRIVIILKKYLHEKTDRLCTIQLLSVIQLNQIDKKHTQTHK